MVDLDESFELEGIADYIDTLVLLLGLEKYLPQIFIIPLHIKPHILRLVYPNAPLPQKLLQHRLNNFLKLKIPRLETPLPLPFDRLLLNLDLLDLREQKISNDHYRYQDGYFSRTSTDVSR